LCRQPRLRPNFKLVAIGQQTGFSLYTAHYAARSSAAANSNIRIRDRFNGAVFYLGRWWYRTIGSTST